MDNNVPLLTSTDLQGGKGVVKAIQKEIREVGKRARESGVKRHVRGG